MPIRKLPLTPRHHTKIHLVGQDFRGNDRYRIHCPECGGYIDRGLDARYELAGRLAMFHTERIKEF
jgi:PHP family Zn ribbon phosphoesterase